MLGDEMLTFLPLRMARCFIRSMKGRYLGDKSEIAFVCTNPGLSSARNSCRQCEDECTSMSIEERFCFESLPVHGLIGNSL
jgi:hypothetical protein